MFGVGGAYPSTHMDIRGQRMGVYSILLSCASLGWNVAVTRPFSVILRIIPTVWPA